MGLTPEELAQTEEAQADLCYLVESDIEVRTLRRGRCHDRSRAEA